jgi:ATP-dependent protease ClpP protease subunit
MRQFQWLGLVSRQSCDKDSFGRRRGRVSGRLGQPVGSLGESDDHFSRQVDDEVANVLVAQLLYLAQEDKEKDITLYINR